MPPRRLTYQGIADDLADRIKHGEYPPDQQIPSYTQLAALYGVSVATAQRAVALLRDRGLVVGVAGIGVFVAPEEA